jgi:hypothetical protein
MTVAGVNRPPAVRRLGDSTVSATKGSTRTFNVTASDGRRSAHVCVGVDGKPARRQSGFE